MPSCVVKWCINDANNHPKYTGITFHRFPKKSCRRESWVRAVRLERRDPEWRPFGNARICSMHFDEGDFYVSERGKRLLKKAVVPVCTMVGVKREPVPPTENRREVFVTRDKQHEVTQNYDVSIVKQEPLSGTESNDTDHFDGEGPPILCPILHNDPLEIATSIGRDDATVEKILKYQIRKLEHTDKCNRQKIKTLQHKVRVQSERIATLERLVRTLRRRDSLTEEEKTGLKAVDETSIKFIKEEPAQASDTEIKMEPEWIP